MEATWEKTVRLAHGLRQVLAVHLQRYGNRYGNIASVLGCALSLLLALPDRSPPTPRPTTEFDADDIVDTYTFKGRVPEIRTDSNLEITLNSLSSRDISIVRVWFRLSPDSSWQEYSASAFSGLFNDPSLLVCRPAPKTMTPHGRFVLCNADKRLLQAKWRNSAAKDLLEEQRLADYKAIGSIFNRLEIRVECKAISAT